MIGAYTGYPFCIDCFGIGFDKDTKVLLDIYQKFCVSERLHIARARMKRRDTVLMSCGRVPLGNRISRADRCNTEECLIVETWFYSLGVPSFPHQPLLSNLAIHSCYPKHLWAEDRSTMG